MKDFFTAIFYIIIAIFSGWIISLFGFALVWSIAIPAILIIVLSKKYDYDKKNNEEGIQSKKTEKIDKNPTPVFKKNHPVPKNINSKLPGFWSKTGHHLRTNAHYPSFDFDENGWSKTPVYLPKTASFEYVHVDTGDRINEEGKTRREVINEKAKIEQSLEKKEVKPIPKNINNEEVQRQSKLNQLNIQYSKLIQEYYSVASHKAKIVQTINDFEKNKFDSIGEITLKILELKQNQSYRSMEEYKSYLALYEAHKQKDYHVYSTVEKFDTTFVSNIPSINNKIKDIQFKITMLQKELKVLENKDVYKLAKTLDSKSYFEKEKQKLQLELDALEAQKKPLKKFTVQELPFIQDKPFKIKITEIDDTMMTFIVDGTHYSLAIPKNVTWKDAAIQQNEICTVLKAQNGNGMRLNLIEINGKPTAAKETKATIYEDKELSQLKVQLKSLESRLQELTEQKTEYLNDLEEFNREYNIRLGGIIRDILNLRKEILNKKIIQQQNLKTKYQEDLQTFEETQATIEELKSSIDELKEVLDLIDEDHEDYEEILTAYNELNNELDRLEQELSEQETDLAKTKEFLDDELFQQYEEAKGSADEFDESYEHIKEFQKEKIELGDEEKAELKKLVRKAARLCHPDIVPDELKEQSTQMMQQLNAAYDKQDLAQVRKILDSLENGSGFELSSDRIEDKERLKEKIQEYKENISHIESEIEEILHDDTYQTIVTLDNWDAYFEELKKDLEAEKQKLEEEAKSVLESNEALDSADVTEDINDHDDEYNSIPGWMHVLWEWADTNNVMSGKIPRKAENLNSLRVLDLTGQKLTYLPDEIVNLQNVTEIALWDCGLRYLPKNIVEFRSLKKLNLRTNPALMLTRAQEEWIEDLRRTFCTVYKDPTLTIGDIVYDDIRKQNSDTSEKVPLTNYDEQCKIVLDWMVDQFQKIYKVDLRKEYKAYIRVKDTASQVVRDFQHKGSSKIELRYLVNKMDFVVKYVDYETFGIVSSTKPNKTVQEAPQSKAKPAQETPKKILSESSSYANHIKSIEVPNFEKIRRYCNNLVDENKADKMQEYLAENGRMHKAIIYDALEQFIGQLNGKEITLVDWGCGQGIASMLVLDYIREKQIDVRVKNVILIDDDVQTLGRAMAQVDALKEKSVVIEAIDANVGSVEEHITTLKVPIIHLFANDMIPADLSKIRLGSGYAVCLSHQDGRIINIISSTIGGIQISKRDEKIGRFQRFERILKVN